MYGKLFESMFDGSLATHGPWEAIVTFQQLIILANKHGEVDMTAEAISRRTTIPLPILIKGISELLKPDPHSRTPDEEGRRIIPLQQDREWGWKIVNYQHYRQIRSAEERREYMRQYQTEYRKQNKQNKPREPKTDEKTNSRGSKQYALYPPNFEKFWSAYPKKVGKVAALKSWLATNPSSDVVEKMLRTIEWEVTTEQWQEKGGRFIPHPSTWLNQGRWQDEPTVPVKRKLTIKDAI